MGKPVPFGDGPPAIGERARTVYAHGVGLHRCPADGDYGRGWRDLARGWGDYWCNTGRRDLIGGPCRGWSGVKGVVRVRDARVAAAGPVEDALSQPRGEDG